MKTMDQNNKVLLDVFRLEDRYNLGYTDEIVWRAEDCMDRRAEMYGWCDVEIKHIKAEFRGDITEYTFEIWGVENGK